MDPILTVIHALGSAHVSFVVVGGVAVVLQGHPRMTVDLDIVVELEHENLMGALTVLADLGLVPRLPVPAEQFADAEVRTGWVEDRNLTVFSFHDPEDPRREVDLFAEMPIPWDELLSGSQIIQVAGVDVPVAGRDHLIRMKLAAGRPQDLADVQALRALGGSDG